MPYRILLTTHHITSRRKLLVLRQAALNCSVSALLKVGAHPPGVMLCEGEEEGVKRWHATAKRLRYKDYRYMGGEEVESRSLNDGEVGLREVGSKREMGECLGEEGRGWWRRMMVWDKER